MSQMIERQTNQIFKTLEDAPGKAQAARGEEQRQKLLEMQEKREQRKSDLGIIANAGSEINRKLLPILKTNPEEANAQFQNIINNNQFLKEAMENQGTTPDLTSIVLTATGTNGWSGSIYYWRQ